MKSLAGWFERSSRVAPQSHRPANKQFFRATGWMFLADKRKANIEAHGGAGIRALSLLKRLWHSSTHMRFDVGEVQASNGKVKVRAWMSSQGTLNRAKSGPELLNPDHPGKVAGANTEARRA